MRRFPKTAHKIETLRYALPRVFLIGSILKRLKRRQKKSLGVGLGGIVFYNAPITSLAKEFGKDRFRRSGCRHPNLRPDFGNDRSTSPLENIACFVNDLDHLNAASDAI